MHDAHRDRIDAAIRQLNRTIASGFVYRTDRAADRNSPLIVMMAKSGIPLP